MFSSPVCAETVTIAWDANTEVDLAGYRVFMDGTQQSPDILCGPNQSVCCIWKSGEIAGRHEFYVISFDTSNFESGPSNTVDNVSPDPPVIRLMIDIKVKVN